MSKLFFKLFITVLVLASLPLLGGNSPQNTSTLSLEETFTNVNNGWSHVERWSDSNPMFKAEDYPPDGRGNQEGQRLTFFNNVQAPHSSKFLLYYANKYDTNSKEVPVLLVHGANDNADRAWANPNEMGSYGCGSYSCPDTGLMQELVSDGHKVFAINFGHKQGDNYYWAEHIHNAIQIIKDETGSNTVNVIGWSKGAFAARMYGSSVIKDGGTEYQDDINKLMLIGNPNKGFDYVFRHGWSHNFSIYPECGGTVNAPSPHTEMVCYGLWRSHDELSIYITDEGNFYPGQTQMLARWDGVYSLPMNEQDWYTTYYGGQGYYTYGFGIDHAINEGSLVDDIITAQIPNSIESYLLAGNQNDIPTIHNEHTGPSDGVVFITSATSEEGIGQVSGNKVISHNHLELGWVNAAMTQIKSWLD
ncbi:lipase [Filobacillus milosensis]|uniref:Lipase n=1 Tax=Filobacillus milosensis TaxID=94137 RepID=A0A4Y8IDB8_9BACI|nr:lipase [Filobacillus milosensis]TFB13916.1 lipase [Filobacillus milosensis]